MQITSNTLTEIERSMLRFAFVVALVLVSACEPIAPTLARFGAPQPSATVDATFRGRVVGVTDGDTLTVLDDAKRQHTIRLAEIDAPERGQPWGDRSRQRLSALTFGKTVSVMQTDTDRYGRTVARVFADGEDINRTMVADGAARIYPRYLTDQALVATERRARQARAGLWSLGDGQTVAPWEWRRGARSPEPTSRSEVGQVGVRSLLGASSSAGSGAFSCSGKRYCRQMASCEEAHFYLRQCGVASLDGNGDGEPCEALCGTMR